MSIGAEEKTIWARMYLLRLIDSLPRSDLRKVGPHRMVISLVRVGDQGL